MLVMMVMALTWYKNVGSRGGMIPDRDGAMQ
jgi:hypothetical protein